MTHTDLPIDQTSLPTKKPHPLFNPLMMMLILFGLPYVLAWYFLDHDVPLPFAKTGNQGTLISPMIPLGEYSFDTREGIRLNQSDLAGKWVLLTVTSRCELTCQQTLFTMRQARKSTGVNRKAIVPILLEQDDQALAAFDGDLQQAFPQLSVAKSTAGFLSTLSQAYPETNNTIYMIDPYGNLMMYYPAGSEQKGLMDDLERLFKVSPPKL